MNKSNINEFSAKTEADSSTTAQNHSVSQHNANTKVVGIPFKSREIKFRVWDTHSKKMIYPAFSNLFHSRFSKYYIDGFGNLRDSLSDKIPAEMFLSQYTGLKDKNGTEIYEGDFLRVWDEDGIEYDFLPQVVWGGNYPAFDLSPSLECEYNELQHATLVGSCEVVGNIFENPELLETI